MQLARLHVVVLWLFCFAYAWNLLIKSPRDAQKLNLNLYAADLQHDLDHSD